MRKDLEAIYEKGVIRPLEQLDLEERQRIIISVQIDSTQEGSARLPRGFIERLAGVLRQFLRPARRESCLEIASRLGVVGAMKDGPSDLSTNSDHFRGFGGR